jgi:hypothetical protein
LRYPPFKKAKLPKERRTIPLRANDRISGREQIDDGKYFRCWYCGFVCNIERDELSERGPGTILTNVFITQYANGPGEPYQDPEAIKLGMGGYDFVLPKADANGDPVVIRQDYMITGTGCPLCHCRAWKK